MGNTCAHPHTPQHKHNYYVAKEQPLPSRSLTGNRTGVPGNNPRQGNSTTPSKFQRLQIEEKHVAPSAPSKVQPLEIEEKPLEIEVVPPTKNSDQSVQTEEKHHVVPRTENSDQSVQTWEKYVAAPTITVTANLEEGKNVITVAIASQAEDPPIPQSNEDKKKPAITAAIATQVEEPPILEGNEKNTSSGCGHVPDEDWEEEDKGEDSVRILNERDECPTCLEGYDEENPKIMTKCNHHYHLGCIFEWMERSATCPMCFKVMEFEETS